MAGLVLFTGCAQLATQTPNAGFSAADEPHAVAVARDILAHGGNAADAAAALGLTLTVTLPSRASLGGGGSCLYHVGRDVGQKVNSDRSRVPLQTIEFLPRAGSDGASIGVPSVVRGLFALQVKYGKLRWAQLVAPAENMARFGVPVSRALVRDVELAHADITGPAGKPLAEGDLLPQGDLANTLAELRAQGGGGFASGALADAIVAGSNGAIDSTTLRNATPNWATPQGVPFGNDVVYFAADPGSAVAEQIWRQVRKSADSSVYATLLRVVDAAPEAGDPVQRAFAVADAGAALAPRPATPLAPGAGDAATSFVVLDGKGNGVACSLTMGRLFGAGRILGTTGILASLPVPGAGTEGSSGAAMMIVNQNTDKLMGALAAGGDPSGPEAMVQVALNIAAARRSLTDALAAARLYAASPDALYAEPGLPLGERKATETAALGAVNGVICPSGVPVEHPDCVAQSDPRGSGMTRSFNRAKPQPVPEAPKGPLTRPSKAAEPPPASPLPVGDRPRQAEKERMVLKVSRRGQVPPFIVMDVMRAANERAASGADVLHLEVGQPSTAAPAGVIAAAHAALDRDTLGYTDSFGLPVLRERIAAHYRRQYDVVVDPARIALTTGSSGAFVLAFLAAFEPGDRVAMAAPSYPAYRNILTALGLVPVELPSGPAQRYQATLDLVRACPEPIDGLIIASPANPTGTMLPPGEIAALTRHCAANGIRLVSDEIYHGLTYGTVAATALAAGDDAIVVNSFSKYFSMTGWRLGWMVVPPALLRAVECLAQNFFISPPSLSQHAALAAFECEDELQRNLARYAENRALLLEELPKAGFDRLAPADGAFYLYADIAHLTNDSTAFCRRMLAETGIACTPGVDFDRDRGHATLRFSFAGSTSTMAEAARRLRSWRRT